MTDTTKYLNPLGYEKISTLIRKFSIPCIIATLVNSVYNLVDQIFIVMGVGLLGNGATNVTFPLITISLSLSQLIGIGCSTSFSIGLGEKNYKKAEHAAENAIWLVVIFGALFAAAVTLFTQPLLYAFGATNDLMPYAIPYTKIIAFGQPLQIGSFVICNFIRADGKPKYSMAVSMTGAFLNMILDPLVVFVLVKDDPIRAIQGVALATAFSQCVSFLMAISYYFRFRHIKLTRDFLIFRPLECIKMLALGLGPFFNQIAMTIVQVSANNVLRYYAVGSIYGPNTPLIAYGIICKIYGVFAGVFMGLHQGCAPALGFNYGAKQYGRVKEVWKYAVKIAFFIGLFGFILFEFFPGLLISIFGSGDELYTSFSVSFMRIYLFFTTINGVFIISSNMFAAIGKPLKGIIITITQRIVMLVPLLFILPAIFGIDGIKFSGFISDLLGFIVVMFMVRREFKAMDKLQNTAKT